MIKFVQTVSIHMNFYMGYSIVHVNSFADNECFRFAQYIITKLISCFKKES